ncbi:MAG: hypothetical protein U0237_13190 [Thermoleophilia bacterium]
MTRTVRLLLAAACGAALGVPAAAAAQPFTTTPKTSAGNGVTAQLYGVRVGRHATYDRIVFDFRFGRPRYDVRYTPRIVADGSGLPVPVLGRRFIEVSFQSVGTDAAAGAPTSVPHVITPLFPQLRQVRKTGEFEAVVSFGLGLRSRHGFRVFRLTSPTRVVIDLAH